MVSLFEHAVFKRGIMKYLTLILASLALIACGGRTHPKMISFTPASVVIDYTANSLQDATSLAQQFCSSINKDAQYVRTEEKGWVSSERLAFFNCVESNRGGRNNGNAPNAPIINNF